MRDLEPGDLLELPAARAPVRGVDDLDRACAQLAGRAVLHVLAEGQVDERVRRAVAVVEEGVLRELGSDLEAVGAEEPELVALEIDHQLSLGADGPELELMTVAPRAEVARAARHRPDRAVVVADDDRVMMLDGCAEDRLHERERRLAAEAGEPQRSTERVRELGLRVAAPVSRVRPRPLLR